MAEHCWNSSKPKLAVYIKRGKEIFFFVYGRNWIYWRVWMIERIYISIFLLCHVSCVTCRMSHFTCYISCVTCHMSHVKCQLSHVTYHLSLMPTAPHLHPDNSLWTVGWFTKTQKIIETLQKMGSNISNPVIDQKSPVMLVPLINRGDKTHFTHIATTTESA